MRHMLAPDATEPQALSTAEGLDPCKGRPQSTNADEAGKRRWSVYFAVDRIYLRPPIRLHASQISLYFGHQLQNATMVFTLAALCGMGGCFYRPKICLKMPTRREEGQRPRQRPFYRRCTGVCVQNQHRQWVDQSSAGPPRYLQIARQQSHAKTNGAKALHAADFEGGFWTAMLQSAGPTSTPKTWEGNGGETLRRDARCGTGGCSRPSESPRIHRARGLTATTSKSNEGYIRRDCTLRQAIL